VPFEHFQLEAAGLRGPSSAVHRQIYFLPIQSPHLNSQCCDEMISTYWGCCRDEVGLSPPWELVYDARTGFRAIALRRFQVGDIIVVERPLCWIHGHHPFTNKQIDEIDTVVISLSEEKQKAFYEMANVYIDDKNITAGAGIFMTNSFDMAGSPHGESCAMYCAIARLNHSCIPNAQQTHIPDTMEEVLIASRTIEVGDEINDCYIDLRASRNDRRDILNDLYKFDCECHACNPVSGNLDVTLDDKRRTKAYSIDDILISVAESDPDAAYTLALDLIKLLESKESLQWSIRYIASAYMNAYHLANALEMKRSIIIQYLTKVYQYYRLLEGASSPETVRVRSMLLKHGTHIDDNYVISATDRL